MLNTTRERPSTRVVCFGPRTVLSSMSIDAPGPLDLGAVHTPLHHELLSALTVTSVTNVCPTCIPGASLSGGCFVVLVCRLALLMTVRLCIDCALCTEVGTIPYSVLEGECVDARTSTETHLPDHLGASSSFPKTRPQAYSRESGADRTSTAEVHPQPQP